MSGTRSSSLWGKFTLLTVMAVCWLCIAQSAFAGSIVGWGSRVVDSSNPGKLVAIAAGGGHNLALKSDGSIIGWGLNSSGQATPPDGNDFVAIAAGWEHNLAIRSELPLSIETQMKLTPKALNCKSKGKWVKAHFVLPEDIAIEDVDSDILGEIESLGVEAEYMDVYVTEDGLVRIELGFDRTAFCDGLADCGSVEITVKGFLTNGQYFYGTETIKIIDTSFKHLAFLSSQWLRADCSKPDWCQGADIDQDSVVNLYDFAFMAYQWLEDNLAQR